ncbi:MAG: TolC family protein [Flavobacteriaceae bacterium CG_4_10_14_3_um_filter_33_47]|nr:MAG: TolC family protein [Flavobacteriaceae bacterium CG17_big_fil_post_rev_8_21_14_2_50_33_15]PIY11895.1 MAG: TolC family protein [Flavobacteriaceae bacterium CG_4_10_14_3_um_filter_33_47]PJB18313.1 MAG: TolC family protein [Flavobacteriaceae bacterium CG_4_9_14_3_um_filter_33_16]
MKTIKKHKILNISYLILVVMLYSTSMNSQVLPEYLTMASQNNPEIQAAYKEFEAALQKAPQVSSLPDPSLTMSAFGRMIETRVGAQEARFSLMQMFPWFGTLEAKEQAANLMAEATFQKYLDSRNEVFLKIKKTYAELYEINTIIQLEEENLKILNNYRELALSKFKSGKGAMVDVVRIDIKRNESETKIQLLKDQNQPLQIEFNSLLNRDLNEMVTIPDSLALVENDVPLERDSLFVFNPKLKGLEKKIASFEAQKKVVKKEGYPMIGLGLDYSIISKRDVPDLEMNGQDAIMPMLSVTLPIFRKKYHAKQKEVDFMLQATHYEKQAVKNNLQTSYSMANYNISKAKTLKELYKKQTESTKQAISLLIAAYSNSGTDFEEILRMNQDLLVLQTVMVSANKNQFIAQSTRDYLISKQE